MRHPGIETAPCSGSSESYPLDLQGIPIPSYFLNWNPNAVSYSLIFQILLNILSSNIQVFPIFTKSTLKLNQIRSDQSLSHVRLFATPWVAAHQASLSITNSHSSLRLTSIESVMPSSHLILCRPLLLPPSIFPSIGIFLNESILCIRWPKYWSFSFSISHPNGWFPLGWKLYTVSKIKTESWLWLRSWTPYCQIQT